MQSIIDLASLFGDMKHGASWQGKGKGKGESDELYIHIKA